MKDRIQIWLDRKDFFALKHRLEKEDNEGDELLMKLYSALVEASQNNTNLERPRKKSAEPNLMEDLHNDYPGSFPRISTKDSMYDLPEVQESHERKMKEELQLGALPKMTFLYGHSDADDIDEVTALGYMDKAKEETLRKVGEIFPPDKTISEVRNFYQKNKVKTCERCGWPFQIVCVNCE